MLHVLTAVKNTLRSKKFQIDHRIFRLHHRCTTFILLLFCFIVSTKQYAGEPIRCSKGTQDHSNIIDIYCYITATYTVTSALNMTPFDGVPYPGIYPSEVEEDLRYHRYYQWVGFMLLLQALCFYLPHWTWKQFEGGQIAGLLAERDVRFCCKQEQINKKDHIVGYLKTRWCGDRTYVVKYFSCEVACLINLLTQMELLDRFLGGQFYCYGIEAVNYWRGGNDPFGRIFPRVTSCTYRYFGDSGGVRSVSVICMLAVNAINEKIFLFLWFWFILLGMLTLLTLIFRVVVFSFSALRLSVLRFHFQCVQHGDLQTLVENGNLSDFLFILLLGQNMSESLLKDVLTEFAVQLRGKRE